MELENSVADIAPAVGYTGNSIPYYDNLMHSEQSEVTEIIRLLWRQTFILEHKYDKRTGRSSTTETTGYAANTWNL